MRRRPQRRERKRILVVTEGLRTEPQYLDRLQQCMRDANAVVKHRGVGKDPRDVVKKCIELRDAASQAGKRMTPAIAWWMWMNTARWIWQYRWPSEKGFIS